MRILIKALKFKQKTSGIAPSNCKSFTNSDNNLLVSKKVGKNDKQIEEDGSIDLWFNTKYHSKSSYPIAQLLRLKILLAKIKNVRLDKTTTKLNSFLLSIN